MGSGVKDHIRADGPEDLPDASLVADIRDDHLGAVEQRLAVQFQLEAVQVGLVVVQHVQRGGIVAADLAAQLLADRTARTGDQDPGAGQGGTNGRLQDAALLPAEQGAEPHRAHVRGPGDPFHGRQEGGQEAHVGPGVGGVPDHGAQPRRRQ